MVRQIMRLVCASIVLSTGCDLAKKQPEGSDDKKSDGKKTDKADDAARSGEPLAPRAGKCAPLAWGGLKLVGNAKVADGGLSLLREPGQVSGAWLGERVDTSDLQISAVLVQGTGLDKFADGVAFAFVDGDAPTEPGAGGPSLGVPQKPIVAAGIHFPMDEPFFFAELWKGNEGVPFLDEPSARQKMPRAQGERLVELAVRSGEVTLAIHANADASSPATVAKAKLDLKGSRALGLTGSTGVYTAQLGWKDLRVAVGERCLE